MHAFTYHEQDVRNYMPADWQARIFALVEKHGFPVTIQSTSVTSREGNPGAKFELVSVSGDVIKKELPWLYDLYLNQFKGICQEYAQERIGEKIFPGQNPKPSMVINVQRGNKDRYENHVDSVPITGLLYVTDHPPGGGGELVASNTEKANSVSEVDQDCETIFPKAGHLLCFDGYHHPHYVRPLQDGDATRIAVVMNYYTARIPESSRPADLDHHLGLA
jgi:hypothetical protein